MKTTTAQRFGSLGKSFQSPSAAAAVLGAALLASGTTDDAETAWSPAAACLLPDVLPVAGTLLAYGGSRQLAAGGTVTHGGILNVNAPSGTTGSLLDVKLNGTSKFAVTYQGRYNATYWTNPNTGGTELLGWETGLGSGTLQGYGVHINTTGKIGAAQFLLTGGGSASASIPGLFASGTTLKVRLGNDSADAALTCGAITASGAITSPQFSHPSLLTVGCSAGSFANGTQYGPSGVIHYGPHSFFGAIQETPTQSVLDPTKSNIPSGKRQGWYNSTLSEFRDWVNIGGTLLKSDAYT